MQLLLSDKIFYLLCGTQGFQTRGDKSRIYFYALGSELLYQALSVCLSKISTNVQNILQVNHTYPELYNDIALLASIGILIHFISFVKYSIFAQLLRGLGGGGGKNPQIGRTLPNQYRIRGPNFLQQKIKVQTKACISNNKCFKTIWFCLQKSQTLYHYYLKANILIQSSVVSFKTTFIVRITIILID